MIQSKKIGKHPHLGNIPQGRCNAVVPVSAVQDPLAVSWRKIKLQSTFISFLFRLSLLSGCPGSYGDGVVPVSLKA